MKKVLVTVALSMVLVAVQSSLLHFVGGGAFSLALALPCVVYLGLHAPTAEGALGAAAVGCVLDAWAGGPPGLLAFLAVLLFLGSRLAGAALDVRGPGHFALLCGAGTFGVGLGALVLTRYVSPPEIAPGPGLLLRILVESALTGALSPLLLLALLRLDALLDREEPGLLR